MGVHLLKPVVGAIVIALTLAGCSNSSSPPPAPTTAPLPTLENPPTRQSTTPSIAGTPAGSSTPGQTPTPEGTPEATPTEPAGESNGSLIDSAVAAFGAVYREELTRDTCNTDNPDMLPCVSLSSDDATVQAGIARFTGGYPDGGGFSFYMGRQFDGEWGYWFGTQQQLYQLTSVPGELRACGGGEAVTVRTEPSSTSDEAGFIPDGSTVSAAEFMLTVAGSPSGGGRGEGWYRVGGDTPGWIAATQSSDASLGSCDLRDAIEGESPRG